TMDEYNPGLYATPNGWNGWGVYTPIGQMVDAYEMKDGTKFDWNNPTIAATPYDNRDPRFYASINYNGAKWRKRSSDVIASDPVGVIQTGFYETWNSNTNSVQIIGGLDTQRGPLKDWNGTYTGYYMRKFIDPTVDAEFTKQDVPWRHFRYAEILLNYAEACIALGEDNEAKLYINMIRKRAGMPAITETGQDLNIRYRNERRIELAFEGHRFFDVRRWMIASAAYADAQSVYILYGIRPDKTTSPTPTSYTVKTVENREWNPKFYLLPIAIEEINRNNKLIQNPLY
ncbi:MAG TPA: RagB/SusD family nutrient uptake outer membrane protein, partial [Flavitalea sp.]|nr:RagB/SusD family nutrient uptake outer membrane protein [Flavitalea sp.]